MAFCNFSRITKYFWYRTARRFVLVYNTSSLYFSSYEVLDSPQFSKWRHTFSTDDNTQPVYLYAVDRPIALNGSAGQQCNEYSRPPAVCRRRDGDFAWRARGLLSISIPLRESRATYTPGPWLSFSSTSPSSTSAAFSMRECKEGVLSFGFSYTS